MIMIKNDKIIELKIWLISISMLFLLSLSLLLCNTFYVQVCMYVYGLSISKVSWHFYE
jgi:hypothetical protein